MTDWPKVRRAIKARDRVCTTAGCGRPIKFVDYVVHPSEGGSDDPSNLRGQCHRCHYGRPLLPMAARPDATRPWLTWGRPMEDRGAG